jgi:hypothetical protein
MHFSSSSRNHLGEFPQEWPIYLADWGLRSGDGARWLDSRFGGHFLSGAYVEVMRPLAMDEPGESVR